MAQILIAGGGVGGLSAALALARACAQSQTKTLITLFERATEFSEVGAGIQLGPNVMRLLHGWGLKEGLDAVVALPERLQIRSALSGEELGLLALGASMAQRYGAPYATIHRADLHSLLVQTLRRTSHVALQLNQAVKCVAQSATAVTVSLADKQAVDADLLVAADGGWSALRQQLLGDGTPQPTGHLAYRALVRQSDLPVALRSQQVTAWLGPKLHVVQYPVRAGEWLNLVAIVHGRVVGDMSNWDHSANALDLQQALAATCQPLNDLISAIKSWRLWPLSIRAPMQGAHQHAKNLVALLGDAAHPMVPYLAQGAAMAIEDAATLARVLSAGGYFGSTGTSARSVDVAALLQQYAQARWQRNARVQARAIKNGEIFHATGPMRWGRDIAMRLLGERLLDMPWLYSHQI
jgi:salicylate hydroxylase